MAGVTLVTRNPAKIKWLTAEFAVNTTLSLPLGVADLGSGSCWHDHLGGTCCRWNEKAYSQEC